MSKNETKKHKPDKGRNNPLFELMGYHHRAVELRYEGKTYKEITGFLAVEFKKGVHFDTVRKWFARGGLLENEYMEYSSMENDRRRKLMLEETKKLLSKIPSKLDKLLERLDDTNQPDMVVLMTVKTLIEMLGVTAQDAKPGSALEQYFKRLEKAPLPDNQPNV